MAFAEAHLYDAGAALTMPAREHFRAHGRRHVDLASVLREHSSAFARGGRIKNLSLGGACVEFIDPGMELSSVLEPESTVTMEVTAPNRWDPLLLRGKVVWTRRGAAGRPMRAGIRFEHRDAASLYALFQLLAAHAYD